MITISPKRLLVEVSSSGVIDLDLLNAESRHPFELVTETEREAARWVDAPDVTAFVVDDSFGQAAAVQLFQRLQDERNPAPFVYVPGEPAVLSSFGPVLPDLVLRRPVNHRLLVKRIDDMLNLSTFSDAVIQVTTTSLLETTSGSFVPHAEVSGLRFRASQVPVYEINATIPLCGEGISGHLTVSASRDALTRLHRRLLPVSPRPNARMLEDLVGEMSNQLLGGLKQVLGRGGVDFALGVPMMYTGSACPVRYRSRCGSLQLDIRGAHPGDEIAIDLALDSMREDCVQVDETAGLDAGEVAFL